MIRFWCAALLVGVLGAAGMVGCAGGPAAGGSAATPGSAAHAECLVCKHNADLACVDIVVDKETPAYVYEGRTYYFCSEECRAAFEKSPERYVAKK